MYINYESGVSEHRKKKIVEIIEFLACEKIEDIEKTGLMTAEYSEKENLYPEGADPSALVAAFSSGQIYIPELIFDKKLDTRQYFSRDFIVRIRGGCDFHCVEVIKRSKIRGEMKSGLKIYDAKTVLRVTKIGTLETRKFYEGDIEDEYWIDELYEELRLKAPETTQKKEKAAII